jgi:hypothetical protein
MASVYSMLYSKTVTGSPAARRYLAFETDPSGLNNIIMQLEIMVVLAWLTGRTLVVPPPKPIYALGSAPRSALDFLDLQALREHLDVVTAAEFSAPLESHEAFHADMRARGHAPGWNAINDVVVHPPDGLTARLELISRLWGRRPVGITQAVDSCGILYFPWSLEHRMFGVFEAFFLFADPENERRARALVRDAVRYRPDIRQLAERAVSLAPLASKSYSAMHVRRGDFQYRETRIGPDQILRHIACLAPEGETVYLATDETDAEFLRPFRERFRLVQFHDLAAGVVADTPSEWIGVVETLICATAPQRFVGTRLSTFSARIATLRGHLSYGSGRHAGIDTALYYTQPPLWHTGPEARDPYAVPRRKHRDEYGETGTPWWQSIAREPVWGRAYEAVWAETGHNGYDGRARRHLGTG